MKFPENREKFAKAWGVESLPAHTGYRISELPHRAAHGEVRAAYIMGEDPLQTDAELSAVRKGFEDLELVIVQDIFMTKTAAAADVILPSTSWGEHEGVYTAADRGFQRFFKAVEPKWGSENGLADHQRNRHPHGLPDALQQHPGDLGRVAASVSGLLWGNL